VKSHDAWSTGVFVIVDDMSAKTESEAAVSWVASKRMGPSLDSQIPWHCIMEDHGSQLVPHQARWWLHRQHHAKTGHLSPVAASRGCAWDLLGCIVDHTMAA
jgi:hypothetical protein